MAAVAFRLKRSLIIVLLLALFAAPAVSQMLTQRESIRIQLWAELDAFPGFFEDEEAESERLDNLHALEEEMAASKDGRVDISIYRYAIARTKEIAPYLMAGMLYGWTFEYTPYDKTRRVDEYFDFNLIKEFDSSINTITYHAPRVLEDRLVCWAYCDRTEVQKTEYKRWESIMHPRVRGVGQGPVSQGFEGIKIAVGEAIKNAVREHWRSLIRNKPKEIDGVVLLTDEPRIYIKDGQYTVELDFFIETDRIIEYTFY